MNTSLDCVPCFVRQALEASRFATDDPVIQERVVRFVLGDVASMDFAQSPPAVGQRIHRLLRQLTGDPDPYRRVKDAFNRMALNMMPGLTKEIEDSDDPLYYAVRLAIAANIIDLGVKGGIGEGEAQTAIHNSFNEPFCGDIQGFRDAVLRARSILYLADNAGEIVFDRLLTERLPAGRVTLAVRGAPVLNDATHEDAEQAGLTGLVEITDNGSDAPGTILADCGEDFRRRFGGADVVIAKGQGNYETLSGVTDRDIFFLLKVKCPVIGRDIGHAVGTHLCLRAGRPASHSRY